MRKFLERLIILNSFDVLLSGAIPLYPCWIIGYPLSGWFFDWVASLSRFAFGICCVVIAIGILLIVMDILAIRKTTQDRTTK